MATKKPRLRLVSFFYVRRLRFVFTLVMLTVRSSMAILHGLNIYHEHEIQR